MPGPSRRRPPLREPRHPELIANIWTAVSPADEHDAVISLVAAATGDTQHAAIADAIILWDAVELLVGVRVPTLVIVGRDSTNVSIEQIRQIATTIPGTAVHTIPSKFAPYFGGRDEALAAIGRFLGWRQTTPDSGPSHFRTVVFIDIVGSTEVLSHLGDEAGRTATRTIETTIGAVADSHAGSIVKHLGDGTLLEFPSASEALAFAAVVQHRLSDSALSVRVGMAAGEPIRENGDLHGAVVVQASRVADLAGAGEVLAADSVRQLVIGKEFAFETLGPKNPQGIRGERRRVAAHLLIKPPAATPSTATPPSCRRRLRRDPRPRPAHRWRRVHGRTRGKSHAAVAGTR